MRLTPALFLILSLLAGLASAQPTERRVWQPIHHYFTTVEPEGNGQQSRQRVNPFFSYTHIGSDFGFVGPAEGAIGWQRGMVCAELPEGPDGWAGMWHSLARLARMSDETLTTSACYPSCIVPAYQPSVEALRMVAFGKGDVKLELITGDNKPLVSQKFSINTPVTQETILPLPSGPLPGLKFLNWIAEPGSDVCIDALEMQTRLPAMDFDFYVLLNCYAKVARCYSPNTGLVRDRAHVEDGGFDSVPATGLFALATAAASTQGIVKHEFAVTVLKKAEDVVGSLSGPENLLPHFARLLDGRVRRHPGTEYSTVDTAIFYHSMIAAAEILGETQCRERLGVSARKVNYSALRNAEGYVSHGYKPDGTIIPFIWKDWGGESALVLMAQRLHNQSLTAMMSNRGRVHEGCGFIQEIQNLVFPDFQQTKLDCVSGINWHEARRRLLDDQKAYFPRTYPDSWAAKNGVYGLSAGEGAFGIGYTVGGVEKANQSVIHPHYILMSGTAEENPAAVYDLLKRMEDQGLLPPWGIVENVLANGLEYLPMIAGLNASFEAVSAYHLYAKNRSIENQIYAACERAPELREAAQAFYR